MDKCVIWGLGGGYENILNVISFEVVKNNIEIIAMISSVDSMLFHSKDGIPIIKKEQLDNYVFDYLIITSSNFFSQIEKEAVLAGIERDKIVNGAIFNLPLFDWKKYISLIRNPITILSDDCWAGYLYHRLFLPFSSPCINISWDREDYIRFAKNPLYYLNLPLELVREGNVRKNQYPIGKLGKDGNMVKMNFVHATSFHEAKILWDRRTKRVNPKRIFVKFALPACEDNADRLLEEFDKISFPKIAFFSGETRIKDVIYLPRFEWYVHQGKRTDTMMFNDYVRSMEDLFRDIDVLKLLNYEKDFIRSL